MRLPYIFLRQCVCCSERDLETMLITWQRRGQAYSESFILLAVLRSIPLSHTHIHTHTRTHTPLYAHIQLHPCRKRERDVAHSITQCPDKMKVEMWRGPVQRVLPHNKPKGAVCVCVCLLVGVAVVFQTARGKNEGESASCLLCEGFHVPIRCLFFMLCVMCCVSAPPSSLSPSFSPPTFHHLADAPCHNSPVLPPPAGTDGSCW